MLYNDKQETIQNSQSTNSAKKLKLFDVYSSLGLSQAAQTHVAMEGCNVIYITYVTRAGVALQATVENIRDFVWEICHWDLRTPNNAKPYFFLNEMNKKVLPAIYSAAVWCLFVVLLFFWLYYVTTVTPFIERSEGWSLPSVGVLDQSQKKCCFLRGTSGFRAVPVTTVALTKVSNFKCKLVARVTISTYATGARAEMTR